MNRYGGHAKRVRYTGSRWPLRLSLIGTGFPSPLHFVMNPLSIVFVFKIAATILVWCVPLILMPAAWFEALGFPKQETYMFLRMLGWAYLALCVGYWFGLKESLQVRRAMGPIWMGIVSNGGAFLYLAYYGIRGTWESWGMALQVIGWGSVAATFLITVGLFIYGVRGSAESARKSA